MKIELFHGRLKRGEQANSESDSARAVQDIDPAAHALNGFGKIEGTAFDEGWPLFGADRLPGDFEQDFGWQGFPENLESASDAHGRRQPGFQVQVAGPALLGAGN